MKLIPVDKYRNSLILAVKKAATLDGIDIHHIYLSEVEATGLMDEWFKSQHRDADWQSFYIPDAVIRRERTVTALRAVDNQYETRTGYDNECRIGQTCDNFSSVVRDGYPRTRDEWIAGRIKLQYQPKGDNRPSIDLRVVKDKVPLPDTSKFKRLFKKVR